MRSPTPSESTRKRTSPRKTTGQLLNATAKVRQPRRCRQCPDHPLMSECPIHSKRGKQQRLETQAQQSLNSPITMPSLGNELELPPSQLHAGFFSPIGSLAVQTYEYSLPAVPFPHISPPPMQTTPTHLPYTPQVDPALPTTALTTETQGEEPANARLSPEDAVNDDPNTVYISSAASSPHRARRAAPRDAEGIVPSSHLVQGVMRGPDNSYRVQRIQPKPEPILDSAKASKTFRELMNTLLIKCEDLSLKTGCWLFLGAQHAAGSGGAIHYASPRLRRDGSQATDEFATSFLQLIKQVSDSKKKDVLELQLKVDEIKRQKESMANQIAQMASDVENAKATTESLQRQAEIDAATLAEYRHLLGFAQVTNIDNFT